MCDKAILQNVGILESVPGPYKNQQMCDKAIDNYPHALKFVLGCYMTQKCVIKLSMLIFLQYNLFLNALRLNKRVIKLLIDILL